VISSEGDLALNSDLDSGMAANYSGASITSGGSLVIGASSAFPSERVNINGATITGPSTAGASLIIFGSSGTPASITGFEPLYREGALGAVQSSYGSSGTLIVPPPEDVSGGVEYGDPDDPIIGELTPGGGGMIVIGSGD
jgi:hypothetical protein